MAIKRNEGSTDLCQNTNSGLISGTGVSDNIRYNVQARPHSGTLADSDFTHVNSPTRQANILIVGEPKTGKTTFATRFAPDPIAILSFDGRSNDAAYEAEHEYNRKVVGVANLLMPQRSMSRDETKVEARLILEKAIRNVEISVEESKRRNIRTLLIDGIDIFGKEICKLALDGTMEKVKEHSHGEPGDFANRQVWRIANLARNSKSLHLVMTTGITEIWKDQKPTGLFKPEGPKATLRAVDWAGWIRNKTVFGRSVAGEYEMEIISAGTDGSQLGKVYTQDDWETLGGPFVYACCENYKDSIPDDWK